MNSHSAAASGLLICLGLLPACSPQISEIVLASTTSVEDSGLLDTLLPVFRQTHPEYRIRTITVGSGEALRLAARGDADVVLSHSPAAEEEFMAAGHGATRHRVMYNDFVVVGPPAGVAQKCAGSDAAAALRCIARSGAAFISRGDESGTHVKERALWAHAGVEPSGAEYLEAGQGMGAVLAMASELGAYTLTDRGTFLSMQDRLMLSVLVEGDVRLRNQYSVIVVRDAANSRGARVFADWLTAPAAQTLIGDFGLESFGRPLFTPNAQR